MPQVNIQCNRDLNLNAFFYVLRLIKFKLLKLKFLTVYCKSRCILCNIILKKIYIYFSQAPCLLMDYIDIVFDRNLLIKVWYFIFNNKISQISLLCKRDLKS